MKILIDNGHGIDTAGKRSPDGRLREYIYTRYIANMIVNSLRSQGYDAECIVPEMQDIKLSERTRRVNEICKEYGAKNVILISIHCNAAGMGDKWMSARGWSAYTSKGQTKADLLAEYLYRTAKKYLPAGTNIRKDLTDGDSDIEADFWILRKSACPAVLTENLFQDNKKDVEYLLSDEGRNAIVQLHITGIINFLKSL